MYRAEYIIYQNMIPSQTNLTAVVVKTAKSFAMQTYILQSFPQEIVRAGLYSLLYSNRIQCN